MPTKNKFGKDRRLTRAIPLCHPQKLYFGRGMCRKCYRLSTPLYPPAFKYLVMQEVSQIADLTLRQAILTVNSIFKVISLALKDKKVVSLDGFGSFEVRPWKDKLRVRFKPHSELKQMIKDYDVHSKS